MPVFLRTFMLLTLSVLLGACAAPSMDDQSSAQVFDGVKLYPINNSGFKHAYVAQGAGLSSYRSVAIAPLDLQGLQMPDTVIPGSQRGDLAMTPARETEFRKEWASAMDRAFSGYDRSGTAKPLLRIAATLISFKPGLRTTTTIGGDAQPAADALDVSIEFRLSDAGSGQLLAVIKDTRSITAGALSRSMPVTIPRLFGSWAALLHTRVSGR